MQLFLQGAYYQYYSVMSMLLNMQMIISYHDQVNHAVPRKF